MELTLFLTTHKRNLALVLSCPSLQTYAANICLFKVRNKNNRKKCGICSKLTKKHQNDVNDVVLVFLLLTLNIFHTFFNVSTVDFEQANVSFG